MKSFQYTTAPSPGGAVELLGDNGCYLAGGNDLLGLMKEYIAEPQVLVNLKTLPGLDSIESGESQWSIGANVTVAQIEEHEGIQRTFPALQQAAAEVGSLQIRNVATVGGNLAQHSRCWYYRHRDLNCLKKGGDTCFARHGENKYHSIFSGNTCISPVVSNLSIALAALEAVVVVQRGGALVRLSIPELYTKAWDNPTAHHSLDYGDLILRVEVPNKPRASAYLQLSEKAAFDWALVSCAAAATLDGNRIRQAKIFLGAVAPVPFQVPAANALMTDQELDETLAAKVADRLLKSATPLAENGYKVPMAHALIRRTLLKLRA
jgi:xanthine dehydrogenase YagS FAD-binding subunit